jgi:sulfur carrier protein ThiS
MAEADLRLGVSMPKIIYRDREWEVRANINVRDAIKKGGLNPETVLATREGKLITEDIQLKADDVIKLVAVISGGASRAPVARPDLERPV